MEYRIGEFDVTSVLKLNVLRRIIVAIALRKHLSASISDEEATCT